MNWVGFTILYPLHPRNGNGLHSRLHQPLSDSNGWAPDTFLLSVMQKRYGEALHLHRRALTILVKALGVDHPDVAVALGYNASCLTELVSAMVSANRFSSFVW